MVKILCVEDEAALREDLVEVLEEEGYEVAVASNGSEGLRLLTDFNPDLILSDCLMPVMNGIDMLQAIRSGQPRFATTPVVFLSAHAQKEQVEKGVGLGAQHYLTKPVDYSELVKVLRSLLEARSREARGTPDEDSPAVRPPNERK
ncbi:response regulator [Pelagibius marinus]|uniref:response regulator n=1 Tax=Pelagibius marinus TaxID=2762760 RepID=UPI001872E148|nr:response regulator [Pelagibius marinus]